MIVSYNYENMSLEKLGNVKIFLQIHDKSDFFFGQEMSELFQTSGNVRKFKKKLVQNHPKFLKNCQILSKPVHHICKI